MMNPKLLLSLSLILSPVILAQRYYACDPRCLEVCSEKADETDDNPIPICVHIQDVFTEIMTFPNNCAFDCANKCYEYQLHIKHNGSCGSLDPRPTAPTGFTWPQPGTDSREEEEN